MTDKTKGITVRDIFDQLREGKKVSIGFDNNEQGNMEEQKLLNHLNVIKSRAKSALEEFGFNFENCIFKVTRTNTDPESPTYMATFFIEGERETKRYSNFTIE